MAEQPTLPGMPEPKPTDEDFLWCERCEKFVAEEDVEWNEDDIEYDVHLDNEDRHLMSGA